MPLRRDKSDQSGDDPKTFNRWTPLTKRVKDFMDNYDPNAPLGEPDNPAVLVPAAVGAKASNAVVVGGEYYISIADYRTTAGAVPLAKLLMKSRSFDGWYVVDATAGDVPQPLYLRPDKTAPRWGDNPTKAAGTSTANAPAGSAQSFIRTYSQKGDIVFASHPVNYMSWGTFQHCALVVDPANEQLIESLARIGTDKPGVRQLDWPSFTARNRNYSLVWLTRLVNISSAQTDQVVAWARSHIGTPYRWPAYDGTDKNNDHRMYCSQLVWVDYMRTLGVDLDSDGGSIVSPDDIYYSDKIKGVKGVVP